jgi:hypothetical protein
MTVSAIIHQIKEAINQSSLNLAALFLKAILDSSVGIASTLQTG